eukprot:CAMPEP_0206192792 /NCGR_PEP_ID=MMETSP0166-20121206/6167_1 /ASSEMBLY_ACC=CAM_ASM_000260 /TAXON_ID=95228 /ORGANISM="Vannella robusta, Strain DIVA3 518/3/11/1/6" /LENGTH=465 /DNA_ID=CAMNT_0053609351 /DNA_START=530 /DNA_END=1925 /DNA_ORIENTATION=-
MASWRLLNLSHNGILEIHPDIALLKNLESLDVDYNKIELPPFVLGTLELKEFKGHNNPLTYVPIYAREKDSSFLKYLKDGPQSVDANRVKLLAVGTALSGKTYLIRNVKRDALAGPGSPLRSRAESLKQVLLSDVSSADGMDQATQVTEFMLNKVRISAWDFGKSDLFYRTHQYFLTGRAIYLIVIRAYEVEPRILDYWLQQINSVSVLGKSRVIVVATHIDDPKFTDTKSKKARHCLNLYASQSRVDGCIFLSNKTKENFPALRKLLVSLTEEHPLTKLTISGPWNQVLNHCKYIQETFSTPAIEWKTMKQIIESKHVPSEEWHDLLEYLRDSGIVSFQTIAREGNPDFVVLSPEWLTNMILQVRDFMACNQITNGIIEHESLARIWEFSSPTILTPLLELLYSIEIAYSIRGEPVRSLIPSLLPDGLPDNISEYWPALVPGDMHQYGRIYRFHLPSSEVFTRL